MNSSQALSELPHVASLGSLNANPDQVSHVLPHSNLSAPARAQNKSRRGSPSSKAFQELRELLRIVEPNLDEPLKRVWNRSLGERANSLGILYALLNEPGGENEQHVATLLGLKPSSNNYMVLRAELKGLLLNFLFGLDLKRAGFSRYAQQYYQLRRLLFIVETLRDHNAGLFAEALCEKGLALAQTLEAWDVEAQLLRIKRSYSAIQGKGVEHQMICERIKSVTLLLQLRDDANAEVERVQLAFVTNESEKHTEYAWVAQAAERFDAIANSHGTFTLRFLALRLRALASQVQVDYNNTLKVCQAASQLLAEYPLFANPPRLAEYAMKRAFCHLNLRQYALGMEAVEESDRLVRKSDNNWFVIREHEFCILMHTAQWRRAREVVDNVREHERFHRQSDPVKQKWQLYHLYADYVNGTRRESEELDKFLNEIPRFKHDKGGLQLMILSLQIMSFVEAKEYGKLVERADRLNMYRKRYLRGSEHKQADLFIRLVLMLERASFVKQEAERRGKRMIEAPGAPSFDVLLGLQVIPFDDMWRRMVAAL